MLIMKRVQATLILLVCVTNTNSSPLADLVECSFGNFKITPAYTLGSVMNNVHAQEEIFPSVSLSNSVGRQDDTLVALNWRDIRASRVGYKVLTPDLEGTMSEEYLAPVKGVRFREIIITNSFSNYRSSRETINSPCSSLTNSPTPSAICGPLTIFSFITESKCEHIGYGERRVDPAAAVKDNPLFRDGLLLDSREKGVTLPLVHISDSSEYLGSTLQSNVLSETNLGKDYTVTQGVYQEVRKIVPETELPQVAPVPQQQHNIGYILLGFKSIDRNFSQVMLDTWKDWTGARYIYMYLPDDLGLRRISLFHRQLPEDLTLFTYLVLVECHGITTKDKEIRLLDFAQRMRLERLTGYVSVYTGTRIDRKSPKFDLDESVFLAKEEKGEISESLFPNGIIQRNSRM